MRKIKANTSLRKYPIFIKKNIIDDAPGIIKSHFQDAEKMVLITNNTVAEIYRDKMESLCTGTGMDCDIIK